LGIVIVGRGEEVPKDEFGHVHFFVGVHDDRDARPVVPHGHGAGGRVDVHAQLVHGLVPDLGVERRGGLAGAPHERARALLSRLPSSLTLLSAALTRISSKILYRPGTYDTSRTASPVAPPSCAHSRAVWRSVDPTYVSGRSRICSNCVFFW
jgi:hypothetical protein